MHPDFLSPWHAAIEGCVDLRVACVRGLGVKPSPMSARSGPASVGALRPSDFEFRGHRPKFDSAKATSREFHVLRVIPLHPENLPRTAETVPPAGSNVLGACPPVRSGPRGACRAIVQTRKKKTDWSFSGLGDYAFGPNRTGWHPRTPEPAVLEAWSLVRPGFCAGEAFRGPDRMGSFVSINLLL